MAVPSSAAAMQLVWPYCDIGVDLKYLPHGLGFRDWDLVFQKGSMPWEKASIVLQGKMWGELVSRVTNSRTGFSINYHIVGNESHHRSLNN